MTAWNPFADQRPADPDRDEREADALGRAREERIDQQIRAAVTRAVAEPTLTERIHDQLSRRNSKYAERIFPPDDGPDAA